MAKDDNAKVKMTVIHFETESSNAALQENIKQIANTIARTLAQPARVIVAPAPVQLTSGDGAEQTIDLTEIDTEAIDAEATPVSASTKKTPRRPTSAKVLNDIDMESGDVPLKSFYEQKQPSKQSERYLVIAAWLKEVRAIDEITGDHIYTAYRWLGMNTPRDITQPLRDMKTQGWFDSGSTRGTYAINRIGLNEVNNMGKTE